MPAGGRRASDAMYLYPYEEVKQLEPYFRTQCGGYPGGDWGRLLLVGTKLPLMALASVCTMVVHMRSIPYYVFGFGLMLAGLLTSFVAALDALTPADDAQCANRVRARPDDGAAILWYIFAWWISEKTVRSRATFVQGLLLLLAAVWHAYADARLGLHSPTEVLLGALCGMLTSYANHVCLSEHSLLPTPLSRFLRQLVSRVYDPMNKPQT